MAHNGPERVLLIGDTERQVAGALATAMPSAQVTAVATYFDGLAELAQRQYTAVIASAEPIERRPEAAMRTLRQLSADARVVLFGDPTLEPLSRKMMDFGCDDYLISPASTAELQQVFGTPVLRIAPAPQPPAEGGDEPAVENGLKSFLDGSPLAELVLAALVEHPSDAPAQAIRRLNTLFAPAMHLIHTPAAAAAPQAQEGKVVITQALRWGSVEFGQLHLLLPREESAGDARHFLSRLADLLGRLFLLQDRHNRLQKLAITDELTSLYNARYFRHCLTRILEQAQAKKFPVTLFIFDIDNFKKYNDLYGHGVGDEILKETASLMRRCCREHDVVARIGGDEFAVVFWDKEGPRQPKEPKLPAAAASSRIPQTPIHVLDRFRKQLATKQFPGLGLTGKGVLTISGGLAIYPYDARSVEELISMADKELMMRAKKCGKNSIFLVGNPEQLMIPE